MSTTTLSEPSTTQLRLRLGGDYVIRNVSTASPRECEPSEMPVIDLSQIDGDLTQRKRIADEVRQAAGELGFFYIKNHGVGEEVIQKAHDQALGFFKQAPELKEPASKYKSRFANNGWSAPNTSLVNPSEGLDRKEGFGWSYCPHFDPMYRDQNLGPDVLARSCDEPHLWDATSHLPDFKRVTLEYWSACLNLARKLNKIFVLSLDLPEDYFDNVTTFPGADGVYNWYPATDPDKHNSSTPDVGLGSHTDFQCFTLLWQDMSGGLQVLNGDSQWVWATPIEGTFVVNIGDFLARLTNDRYKSTVHRAYNRGLENKERISMPFFFGFNYDAQCAVLPSCTDIEHPAKYAPITCGEWREIRFGRSISEADELTGSIRK